MAFWVPLICSLAVQSLPHPGAPKGDGPGPALQRLHWPTAAHRVPANNCTKNALAPGFWSRARASAGNFSSRWRPSGARGLGALPGPAAEAHLTLESSVGGDGAGGAACPQANSRPITDFHGFLCPNHMENDIMFSGKITTNPVAWRVDEWPDSIYEDRVIS